MLSIIFLFFEFLLINRRGFKHAAFRSVIYELKKSYKILYNDKLELVTIRHYDKKTIDRVTVGKDILVEQKSRNTARFILK